MTKTNPEPQYLTLAQAAQVCQLCSKTLVRAIKDGRLKASQPGGRDYRISRSAIDAWMKQTRAVASNSTRA